MSLNGIDISAWQKGLDTAAVGADFVIVKATEGTTYVNGDCDRAYQAAKNSGKQVGVYHFADGTSTGATEAKFFYENIKGYVKEAILVLDWETNALSRGPGYALDFLNTIHNLTGVKPLIYMSSAVTKAYNWSSVVKGDYGLWAAQYNNYVPEGYRNNPNPPSVAYWSTVAMFQYSSSGITNIKSGLDINVFYGDVNTWKAYAGVGNNVKQTVKPVASVQVATTRTLPKTGNWSVMTIQYWMNICNYYPGAAIDNIDGPETEAGVKAGQRAYGKTVDGKFGNITQCPAEDQILGYETRLKKLGFYKGELDSIPGPALFNAVKAFQKAKGLYVDGCVGSRTYPALFA